VEITLSLENVGKSYNEKLVLNGCSHTFRKSGTVALMGPNGSGKSTLLRICTLLEEPDTGAVRFLSNKTEIIKDRALRRRITLVLPRIGVFNTSVYRNVAYGLKIRGVARDEIARRSMEVLALTGLKHKEHDNALTLSSGETQRLGIARALVLEPEILFLDEPTASVDQENKEIIEHVLTKLSAEKKSLTIIATHDRNQAERVAEEILLMEKGTIVHG